MSGLFSRIPLRIKLYASSMFSLVILVLLFVLFTNTKSMMGDLNAEQIKYNAIESEITSTIFVVKDYISNDVGYAAIDEKKKVISSIVQDDQFKKMFDDVWGQLEEYNGLRERNIEINGQIIELSHGSIEKSNVFITQMSEELADEIKRHNVTVMQRKTIAGALVNTTANYEVIIRFLNLKEDFSQRDDMLEYLNILLKNVEKDIEVLAGTPSVQLAIESRELVLQVMGLVDEYIKNVERQNNIEQNVFSIVADLMKTLDERSTSQNQEFSKAVGNGFFMFFLVISASIAFSLLVSWLTNRDIFQQVGNIVDTAQRIADGNMEAKVDTSATGILGKLARALRTLVTSLKSMIQDAEKSRMEADKQAELSTRAMLEAKEARQQALDAKRQGQLEAANRLEALVRQLSSTSQVLSAQVEQVSMGADTQSARLSESATAMEEMNSTVLEVARNAEQAATSTETAKEHADSGAAIVQEVVSSISNIQTQAMAMKESLGDLGHRAEGIGRILDVISDIADQTNLLALNAAIEAARAGEAGRGFAVVADEVRKLAEKTMQATREVEEAILAIQQGTSTNIDSMGHAAEAVAGSTELAGKAGSALDMIVESVVLSTDQVRAIATAVEEQASASEEITRNIEEVNMVSAETVEKMAESRNALEELSSLASQISALITELREETE